MSCQKWHLRYLGITSPTMTLKKLHLLKPSYITTERSTLANDHKGRQMIMLHNAQVSRDAETHWNQPQGTAQPVLVLSQSIWFAPRQPCPQKEAATTLFTCHSSSQGNTGTPSASQILQDV